jgi:23S rRNA pseudouridine955/2504/2580 synthase/23S rRNA pseudouridine1911/1915/1917 synthase
MDRQQPHLRREVTRPRGGMHTSDAPRKTHLTILYEDDSLVAIDKPAGLVTIPGRGETTSALEQLAAQLSLPHTGQVDPRLRLVHRLDKDTSGVLLFAKSVDAQRLVSHQFQNNAVSKEYGALVAGRPREAAGEIDAPLAPHPTSRKHMTVSKHGRPARTAWRVEEQFRDFSLLRCFPKTGKTHQIRVHLAHIGLPLAVDPLYNPDAPGGLMLSNFKRGYQRARGEEEKPLIGRLTLHAHRLRLRHPNGTDLELEAPLPKDFRAALNMLRKYAKR